MKGFPNQVAELPKLATAMAALVSLVDQKRNARDDGVFGEELVRTGVAGTGHTPIPVAQYLRLQKTKPPSGQSFRTTARGLRELFRLFNFIDDSDGVVHVTSVGRQAASFAGQALDERQIAFWRRAVRNLAHSGHDETFSHPYQVLLRLVGRAPGITRAKCALALEAKDDSKEELNRIVELAALSEEEIRRRIGVTQSNWDNAKKVLPRLAEQLGDVVRDGDVYTLADAPGRAEDEGQPGREGTRRQSATPRAPRSSRVVTPETIARAGFAESSEGPELPPDLDPARAAEANRLRMRRLRRHNGIVQRLASLFSNAGARLFEDPFDVLAILNHAGILVEVKSLDSTPEDERDRVQEALSQLLYYEAFVTPADVRNVMIHKIACFEHRISEAHAQWLNRLSIGVMWSEGAGFETDRLARGMIGPYLDQRR